MTATLYTIGHSVHSIEKFIGLLNEHEITALADVRSHPYSRMNPQFNRENLKDSLHMAGVAYVFLGRELGARAEDKSCYVDGKVEYERVAQSNTFKEGLRRIREGVANHRVALMCAEKDPITCHRMVLVCHQLKGEPWEIVHIREDRTLESQAEAERRMILATGLPEADLYMSFDEILEEAYLRQGRRIAWVESPETVADEATPSFDTEWAT